jgi:type II secretory pathway pseudopilin PulG
MTLLEIMIVLAIIALVMGLLVGPAVLKKFSSSRESIARATAKSIAYEAYSSWAAAHPGKACPDTIAELSEYVNDPKMLDPWGQPFQFLCGPTMPQGAKGVLVISAGPDQKMGTEDDIKSTDE